MKPVNQRRLNAFRRNRRAWYSLWIFSVLFGLSLFAEVIANDRPLLVSYNGSLYMPFIKQHPETTFGGEFDIATDFRDPFIQQKIHSHGWMLWPPVHFSYDTIRYDLPAPAPTAPDRTSWLGTDDRGRDVLARVLYGLRISVLFGFTVTVLSAIIGVAAGAVQGFYGGKLDLFFQRFIEIWSSMPTLFMLIILVNIVKPDLWWLLGFTLLFSWMGFVAVVRAEFLRSRGLEYVQAARALGMGDTRLMFRHILPNAMIATMTFMPFTLAGSVTILTSLDFLGFGLPPGSPSLGELLAQGKGNLFAPWLGFTAFTVLGGVLTLLVFIGEGVRDAFDPRRAV